MSNPVSYELDITGQSPTNKVVGESHVITVLNNTDYNLIVPKFAPFFGMNLPNLTLEWLDAQGNTKTDTLVHGVDYFFCLEFSSCYKAIGLPVYGGISIVSSKPAGTVTIPSYQTLGGEYMVDDGKILEIVMALKYNPRVTTWEQVAELPAIFPPQPHPIPGDDLTNLKDIEKAIDRLTEVQHQALTSAYLSHVDDHSNPHKTTKASVGLSDVNNWPVATIADIENQQVSTKYLSVGPVRAFLAKNYVSVYNFTTKLSELWDELHKYYTSVEAHIAAKGNVHGLDKKDIDLDKVENLPVATMNDLLSNSSSRAYLTADNFTHYMGINGGGVYRSTIDLRNLPVNKFYPVWWEPGFYLENIGEVTTIAISRDALYDGMQNPFGGNYTNGLSSQTIGHLAVMLDQNGFALNKERGVQFTTVKYLKQKTSDFGSSNRTFIRALKHGMKSIYRNKNKLGASLPSAPGISEGQVVLCQTKSGCYLRGGMRYVFATNNGTVARSLTYSKEDKEVEIAYVIMNETGENAQTLPYEKYPEQAREMGWYVKPYSDADGFLENDYKDNPDGYYNWAQNDTVYRIVEPVKTIVVSPSSFAITLSKTNTLPNTVVSTVTGDTISGVSVKSGVVAPGILVNHDPIANTVFMAGLTTGGYSTSYSAVLEVVGQTGGRAEIVLNHAVEAAPPPPPPGVLTLSPSTVSVTLMTNYTTYSGIFSLNGLTFSTGVKVSGTEPVSNNATANPITFQQLPDKTVRMVVHASVMDTNSTTAVYKITSVEGPTANLTVNYIGKGSPPPPPSTSMTIVPSTVTVYITNGSASSPGISNCSTSTVGQLVKVSGTEPSGAVVVERVGASFGGGSGGNIDVTCSNITSTANCTAVYKLTDPSTGASANLTVNYVINSSASTTASIVLTNATSTFYVGTLSPLYINMTNGKPSSTYKVGPTFNGSIDTPSILTLTTNAAGAGSVSYSNYGNLGGLHGTFAVSCKVTEGGEATANTLNHSFITAPGISVKAGNGGGQASVGDSFTLLADMKDLYANKAHTFLGFFYLNSSGTAVSLGGSGSVTANAKGVATVSMTTTVTVDMAGKTISYFAKVVDQNGATQTAPYATVKIT